MSLFGATILTLGALICLAGEVRFLAIAYRYGTAWLLGCLFVPLVAIAFLCLHFKESFRPFTLSAIGLVVAGVGGSMAGTF